MAPPFPRRRPQPDPFEPFYREHARYLAHLVRRCGVRQADVSDVVQEVFVLLHRALLGRLDASRPLRAWLRMACFRKVRDHRLLAREREQPARAGAVELSDVADVAPTPEEALMEISAWAILDALLDELPHEQRLVWVMSEIEEMSNREIAETLEIPEGTVATRLAAARKSVRRAWEERRASGIAAVAPFAMWDFEALVKHGASPPPLPPGFEDEVWASISRALAQSGAADIAAPKVLTMKQAVVGFVLAALLGAGLLALMRAPASAPRDAGLPVTSFSAAPAPSSPSAVPSPVMAALTGTASAAAPVPSSLPVRDVEASDRMLINEARTAIAREDYAGARAALLRVRSARFAVDREALLRDVAAHLDGGP